MRKLAACVLGALLACSNSFSSEKKIVVVATIFPLYDFARQVAGDRAVVKLLLPPGIEPHTFDPKPRDILAVDNAAVFIYGGPVLEPWARRMAPAGHNAARVVVDATESLALQGIDKRHIDPHVWLDLQNDQLITRTIADALTKADPQGGAQYQKNAAAYCLQLSDLDSKIRVGLSHKKRDSIVYCGHAAFGYFAKRYGLNIISPYEGYSPDAEPTPRRITALIEAVKRYHATVVYYEELFSPMLAKTITAETGARLLSLNAAHTVTADQFNAGITFIHIMEQDLVNLEEGLCR